MPSKNNRDRLAQDRQTANIPGREDDGRGPDAITGQGDTPEVGRRDRGRTEQGGPPHHDEPGRGSSIQGPHQDAKGGHMGANQGGAPRGGSRADPSHVNQQRKQDKGDSRAPKGRAD
ncbi:MAG TPA: hypothetical protein VFF65_06440 [Phycisphaerales bacterium]|nr:hypothetical protein [Phycisphaerales bacterium]